MNFPAEETKSGWLTKLGGNSLRKTWKRRWFVLKGSCLYYFRTQTDQEPAGVIPLVSYNTATHDSVFTKKSEFCIRIEKVHRSSDSVHSSNSLHDAKTPPTFIAFADTESEMHAWLTILQRRVGERNIVDIVLDRLDLTTTGLGHRRKGSIGSLRSFYSRNGSTNGTSSSLSSRRPSLDSLSLDAPSLDSRKNSMESVPGQNSDGTASQQSSRSATPNPPLATFGLSAPILRKTVSTSCMHERRTCKPTTQARGVALAIKEEQQQQQQQQAGAPLIMVHNDDSGKPTSSPEAVIFPGCKVSAAPTTPVSNLFPSHLSDEN